jgi:SRSO17 transposase
LSLLPSSHARTQVGLVLLSQKVAERPGENQVFDEIHISALEAEVHLERSGNVESRFGAYVDGLVSVIGHEDRAAPLRDYCVGLVLPGERKSVEPMAALTAPGRMAAQHQSLLHFVGQSPWSDERVLSKVREMVLPEIERHGPIEAWIIDDTGFPKQGKHSVGVKPQYCGQLGREGNCQVAVSLSIANHDASLPVAYRLYLPREWAQDDERRRKARVPAWLSFKTKQEIALEHIRWACEAGLPRGVALMDADYGRNAKLRTELTELGVAYVASIQSSPLVWRPGSKPRPGHERPKAGRRGEPDLISVKQLALSLPAQDWQTVAWREGTAALLSSRFARLRVRVAHRYAPIESPVEEWLLIEWPEGAKEPTRYWLSTLPEDISFHQLVDIAKLRWRIERDYQELKQEVGLGHYEGRGWRGFHHHATLCIAAYGFLISERETIPPSGPSCARLFPQLAVPDGYRPRGTAAAA